MVHELEQLQTTLKKCRRKFHRNNSQSSRSEFLTARRKFASTLKKTKHEFFRKKCESTSNPWSLYKMLGKKRSPRGHITLSDQNGNPICLDPNLNASTLLNRFFPDDELARENLSHSQVQSTVLQTTSRILRLRLTPDKGGLSF